MLWKLHPSQIEMKMLSWISIRYPIWNNFFGKSIDIIQQRTIPRRYFPFLLFSDTLWECTLWRSPFGRWIFPGKLNWACTQRANKRVQNILKVQIMFEQLIKHWFMDDWHDNSTYVFQRICGYILPSKRFSSSSITDKRTDVWSRPSCIYTQIFSPKKKLFFPHKI